MTPTPKQITECAIAGYTVMSPHPLWDALDDNKQQTFCELAAVMIDEGEIHESDPAETKAFRAGVKDKALELGVWPAKSREERKKEARRNIFAALPHFRYAASKARDGGTFKLGILSYKDDGTGKVEASFDADSFFDDLALLVDAPLQTESSEMDAKATELVRDFGG